MKKEKVHVMHSSHLDLYWIGAQADCLEKGAAIIDDALSRADGDSSFHFMIETARFLEYYADTYPDRLPALREAYERGQIEMAASYTDRLENHFGGESLVRNVLYGRKTIRRILGSDCDLCCHPDLPGFAEQTPQIYKKSGIRYYISARGFKHGARFRWQGLDGSCITMYNIPGHYAYYDVDEIISGFDETKRNIKSDEILMGCSAGDMGQAGTFIAREEGGGRIYDIDDLLHIVGARYPQYEFALANARDVIGRMPKSELVTMQGEYPSRWGHHGSALNVQFYFLDKQVERALTDAEKLTTVCGLLGKQISISFDRHPLRDPGGNNGERRYWDLKFMPDTVAEWIEYAWRLQVTTQDHNFGGVEGAQTEFDRSVYKRAALKIADLMIEKSLAALTTVSRTGSGMVMAVNTLNWARSEIVALPDMNLDPVRDYRAVDIQGNRSPILHCADGWQFLARDIPSFGLKNYRIEQGDCAQEGTAQVVDTAESLIVQNKYYRIGIRKKDGCIESFFDREAQKEWMRGGQALCIAALHDDSLGGSERTVVKEMLDVTTKNVRSVRVSRVDCLITQVQVITEVMDVKVYQTISLPNDKKKMSVSVAYNWPGTPDVQLKMELLRRGEDSKITYGVPYGAQTYGRYLETDSLQFGSDEISYELFNRYREVQGFFTVEEEGSYLTVASNQSAYDFVPGSALVLLARDVRNGAERDYRFTNAGTTSFIFDYTSGKGNWTKTARVPWEQRHPVYVTKGRGSGSELYSDSWIDTQGAGVLTVLAPSMSGAGVQARLYNPTPEKLPLQLKTSLGISPVECINMDGTAAEEPLDTLGGFEIKTITLA